MIIPFLMEITMSIWQITACKNMGQIMGNMKKETPLDLMISKSI